jgi:hypothetical protein
MTQSNGLIGVVVQRCENVLLVHRDRDFDQFSGLLGSEAERWGEG